MIRAVKISQLDRTLGRITLLPYMCTYAYFCTPANRETPFRCIYSLFVMFYVIRQLRYFYDAYKKAFSRRGSFYKGARRTVCQDRGGSGDVVARNFIIQLECKVSVGFKRTTRGQTVPRSHFEPGLRCRTHFYPTSLCKLVNRTNLARKLRASKKKLIMAGCTNDYPSRTLTLPFYSTFGTRVICFQVLFIETAV